MLDLIRTRLDLVSKILLMCAFPFLTCSYVYILLAIYAPMHLFTFTRSKYLMLSKVRSTYYKLQIRKTLMYILFTYTYAENTVLYAYSDITLIDRNLGLSPRLQNKIKNY
jgi:hypothetical protein